MDEIQKTLEQEEIDLNKKVMNLLNFMDSEVYKNLPYVEAHLLSKQYDTMLEYRRILTARISLYKNFHRYGVC